MRGIKGQLDSRAENIFIPLLNLHTHPNTNPIILAAMNPLYNHLHRDHADTLISWFTQVDKFESAVTLLCSIINYRTGILVRNVSQITSYIENNKSKPEVINLITELLISSIPINSETRKNQFRILTQLSSTDGTSELELVLSGLSKIVKQEWCQDHFRVSIMNLVTTAMPKANATQVGLLLAVLVDYLGCSGESEHFPILDFRLATMNPNNKIIDFLVQIATGVDQRMTDFDKWASIIILSYCYNVTNDQIETILEHSSICSSSKSSSISRLCFSASIQLFCSNSTGNLTLSNQVQATLEKEIRTNPTDISILRSLQNLVKKSNDIKIEHLSDVLIPNLSHFNRHVRHATLSILKDSFQQLDQFNLMFQAENVAADLENYRQKLNQLRKLSSREEAQVQFHDAFCRYLTGCLYINFNLLTVEVKKMLISEYHKSFELDHGATLSMLLDIMEESIKMIHFNGFDDYTNSISNQNIDLNKFYLSVLTGQNERPDLASYREKIWSLSAQLATYLEPRSRLLIPLFFDFVANEFHQDIKYQNLLQISNQAAMETDCNEEQPEATKTGKKSAKKMIVHSLELISKFENPGALYREVELVEFYLQLLQSGDSNLQIAALKCLISYRKGAAAKYSELLLELANEKSFKVTFKKIVLKEDAEGDNDGIVKLEDQDEIMRLVMRIGFGKMISKVARGTAGGSGSADRQKFVIRTLVDAKSEHLRLFYNLAFKPVEEYNICSRTEEFDLTRIMPLGKQLGVLQTLQVLIKSVNWKSRDIPQLQQNILDSIISMGTNARAILDTKKVTRNKIIAQLREIRTEAIKSLAVFCDSIDWCINLNQLFDWLGEMVLNLQSDSINSPSPLMKLVHQWAKSSHYWFLIFHKLNDGKYLIELLTEILTRGPALVSNSVSLIIMEMVMTLFDEEMLENSNVDGAIIQQCLTRITPILLTFFTQILAKGKTAVLNKEMLELVVKLSTEVSLNLT